MTMGYRGEGGLANDNVIKNFLGFVGFFLKITENLLTSYVNDLLCMGISPGNVTVSKLRTCHLVKYLSLSYVPVT